MPKVNPLLAYCLVITLNISGIYTLLIVNNKAVPSDALSDLFFKEIQSNHSLVDDTYDELTVFNSQNCVLSLRAIIKEFPSPPVIPFFDAWGKIPSGILYGNVYDAGNYDQCVRTSLTLNKSALGTVNGQYCFASIPMVNDPDMYVPMLADWFQTTFTPMDSYTITIGICVPDSCSSPEFLTSVFRSSVSDVYDGVLSGVAVSNCKNGKVPEYRTIDIYALYIFAVFAGLLLLSSTYDFLMSNFKKTPRPIFLAFSIFTNAKKLFAVSTTKSVNSVDCFSGIRFLSMIWVIYIHCDHAYNSIPATNTIDRFTSWFESPWSMFLMSASVSVDSFFFMGGFLVAWVGFQKLDASKGKLNIISLYVHRYIRLTPAVAAVLLFSVSLEKLFPAGPFPQTMFSSCSGQTWWRVLLYLQNYSRECLPHTWYLAVDFQLYILSPLLLIPMWKWGKKFAPVIVILALLSIGWVMRVYIREGFTDLRCLHNPGENDFTYFPTHTRYSPWLVGFVLGYYMHKNRQSTFNIPKNFQVIAWIVCFTTLLLIVFAPYVAISTHGTGTVLEAALYESLKRVSWAIALAWITFACHFGFGGVVDAFLSHTFWQPLGRLTYSLYLVHFVILGFNTKIIRAGTYFSDYNQVVRLSGALGISLVVATAVALTFEMPVLVLEKEIFNKGKLKGHSQ